MYLRVYDSRDSSHRPEPSPSLSYSLTHVHRSIGYHNQPESLVESTVRLMYVRVYDSWGNSRQDEPFPSLCYSPTHAHRTIACRNHTQSLGESTTRLMYLRVYDSRDRSHKTTPSPSLSYSPTHVHRSTGYRNQPQTLTESVTRLMYLRVYHTGPLVIVTKASICLNPPWDQCSLVYTTLPPSDLRLLWQNWCIEIVCMMIHPTCTVIYVFPLPRTLRIYLNIDDTPIF